jgi:hypothetical protein
MMSSYMRLFSIIFIVQTDSLYLFFMSLKFKIPTFYIESYFVLLTSSIKIDTNNFIIKIFINQND